MAPKPEFEQFGGLSAQLDEQPRSQYPRIVEEDLLTTFRFKKGSLQYRLMQVLVRKSVNQFAAFLLELDEHLGQNNLASMAQMALERLSLGVSFHGEDQIPVEGPALIVANHAGWIDSLVALAALKRPDIIFLAGSHPTLWYLSQFREHILFVENEGVADRSVVIRQIIASLSDGKAVLMFPKGLLEPDPALIPGAKRSISDWSDSVGVFLNKVPQTVLQPMLISRMVHPEAWDYWALKRIREQRRRQQLASILQFALSLQKKGGEKWKLRHQVDFGVAVRPCELSPSLDPREISSKVKEQMIAQLVKVYPNQL